MQGGSVVTPQCGRSALIKSGRPIRSRSSDTPRAGRPTRGLTTLRSDRR